MEDERIKVVKNWPEPKSMRNIKVFLGFTNFVMPRSRDLQSRDPLMRLLIFVSI